MPKLHPLEVPWKISPSSKYLDVSTKTFESAIHGYLSFEGFLGEATSLSGEHGNFHQITVILEDVVLVKMSPEFSKSDSERIQGYDWDLALRYQDSENNFKNHIRAFHDHWNATNICPNPSAYRIEESDLLEQLGFRKDSPAPLQFQHYLFVGSDYNIEVVAKSVKWEMAG